MFPCFSARILVQNTAPLLESCTGGSRCIQGRSLTFQNQVHRGVAMNLCTLHTMWHSKLLGTKAANKLCRDMHTKAAMWLHSKAVQHGDHSKRFWPLPSIIQGRFTRQDRSSDSHVENYGPTFLSYCPVVSRFLTSQLFLGNPDCWAVVWIIQREDKWWSGYSWCRDHMWYIWVENSDTSLLNGTEQVNNSFCFWFSVLQPHNSESWSIHESTPHTQ